LPSTSKNEENIEKNQTRKEMEKNKGNDRLKRYVVQYHDVILKKGTVSIKSQLVLVLKF
jgi:hypothetical protein